MNLHEAFGGGKYYFPTVSVLYHMLFPTFIFDFMIPLCCCSVTKSCLTLCDPMDCSTPGSSVLQCLREFAQIHVHWVTDAI